MSTQYLTTETITDLVVALVEAWNSHDLDWVTQFYSDDFEGSDVAQPMSQLGRGGIRKTLSLYFQAFPDLHFTAEKIIVQDDQAALVWVAVGTHGGKVMHIPPTGRLIRIQGVSILTFNDGKIKKASYVWDVAGLLRSLGLLPEL
jgi:steroid delta-isomerase-like uncharacterized protein